MEQLKGAQIAKEMLDHLSVAIAEHKKKPALAVVLVGDDQASRLYVTLKEKAAKQIGMRFFAFNFFAKADEHQILETVHNINADPSIHAMIVQLPLPGGLDTAKIIDAIDPQKDADGFSPRSEFAQSENLDNITIWPVFPRAIIKLIEGSGQQIIGKKAITIANSKEFGETMTKMLSSRGTFAQYVLSADFEQQKEVIKEADIVVSAVGKGGFLKGSDLKDGVIVIDGGIEKIGEKVRGDFDGSTAENKEGWYSPVPGGVGPVTIACLLENTFLAFKNSLHK